MVDGKSSIRKNFVLNPYPLFCMAHLASQKEIYWRHKRVVGPTISGIFSFDSIERVSKPERAGDEKGATILQLRIFKCLRNFLEIQAVVTKMNPI
jgi:hypothetical protein